MPSKIASISLSCYYPSMTQSNIVKISFCFPKLVPKDKTALIYAIVRSIRHDKKIGYAGYPEKEKLQTQISYRFNDDNVKEYKQLTPKDKEKIEKVIRLTVEKCNERLPLSAPPLSVFVFPWLGVQYNKAFGGVTGFTPGMNTIYIFISLEKFSSRSLKETVTHELNHAVFFCYHKSDQTLLDIMVFEGLAENFREEVVGGQSSAWSEALSEKESRLALFSLSNSLRSRSYRLYREVFFGGKDYERWTGYSIGYRIIKSFRKTFPNKSWDEIMRMKQKTIFEMSSFIKK